jgi:hypothetical protein
LRSWADEAGRWIEDAAQWSAAELDQGLAALLRADTRLKSTTVSGEAEIVAEAVLSLGVGEKTAA